MRYDGDIRVHTDRRYANLYNDLKNTAFSEMHDIFFVCVCLGYNFQKSKPLGKYRDQRFWSKTITPDEYTCFYAMMLEIQSMDFTSIKDDKKVIARMEEYANAGMEILINDFLSDYITTENEIPRLDTTASKELAKNVLHFINDNFQGL